MSEATGFGDRANMYPLVSMSTMYVTAEYFCIGEPLTAWMRVMLAGFQTKTGNQRLRDILVGKSPDADEDEAHGVTVGTLGGGPTGE